MRETRLAGLHPLCCLAVDCTPVPSPTQDRKEAAAGVAAEVRVAGVLYKWTNYGRGWRARWFDLAGGVLSYSKIRCVNELLTGTSSSGTVVIGDALPRLLRSSSCSSGKLQSSGADGTAAVRLKIASFRESKSDDRKFYIFSPTKTLHLRTDSREDRAAWIEALVSTRGLFTVGKLSKKISICSGLPFSTERLRLRMQTEGLSDTLIEECENIIHSEFSEFQRKIKLHQNSDFGTYNQLEEVHGRSDIAEANDRQLQLLNNEFSISGNRKYGEYSTTESPDDVEKIELDDLSDEEEQPFFDAADCFNDSTVCCTTPISLRQNANEIINYIDNCWSEVSMPDIERTVGDEHAFPLIERRKKLPEPLEKERSVSLWSIIKDNVGKDLTRVCLPVYFNEPLSSLQKCFEDLEYSYLLDRAYEYGKMGNGLMRILNVAAFAVSGYASSDGRPCKPFNPLLGETYDAEFPEKGIRFFSEKVSHHPMLIACNCEGKGWKFWGDSNVKSKFWGRSIQLDPVGVLTLEFDDGEIYHWSKVTTTIYNLILGKVYCDHHGTMSIEGNCNYSCKLKFKEQSLLDRNPRQVHGFVEDATGTRVATLSGKWDDSMSYTKADAVSVVQDCDVTQNTSLLWKRNRPPSNSTRYNLTSFALTLNELTSELEEKLPPTDSRLRPDQRHLENGEFDKANAEKQRLEKRQRMAQILQDRGWQPRWFKKDGEKGTFRYIGGYWEARDKKKWDGCLNIFGNIVDGVV